MGACDVIVIGAGASGLAASMLLGSAGKKVKVLEARSRIGGRIFTLSDPSLKLPVDLGAEFVHGFPRETWSLIRAAGLIAYDVPDDHRWLERGRLVESQGFWEKLEKIL